MKVTQWTQWMLHNESYSINTMNVTQWKWNIHIESKKWMFHNESYTTNTINIKQWILHNEYCTMNVTQ